MSNFTLPKYDDPRKWIKKNRENNIDWNSIVMARKETDDRLQIFLDDQEAENFWPHMDICEWKELVGLEKKAEERAKSVDLIAGIAQIHDSGQDNAIIVPMDENSSWQLYRKKLINDGFKKETIDEIERTTLKILKRLNSNTVESGPVKGLVIGNVQSGKTANMAALMAMAADWGWNMFIVLSGTIENLRIQTQKRLFNDLNQMGNLFWRSLEHLSKSVDISQKAQNLHFESSSKERYFTVCLKNSGRLKKLIQWLYDDLNKRKQMKILVIDDEADQASINTGKIYEEERKKINSLICSLVHGKTEKNEEISEKYQAMNYIGYTATPYANILNEVGEDSLYPKNFISTLAVSREYFGPQQIFGYEGESLEYEGMDIVRIIPDDELQELKCIHDGDLFTMPSSLIDAVCWFLCGVACMRIWGYSKPVSMLVHTSQKTAHHSNISKIISSWFENSSTEEIIHFVENVWYKESSRFTIDDFRKQYPMYDRLDDEINQYPKFEEIRKQILLILEEGLSHIELDADGELSYHSGIHLCIDNCLNNGITSDGMHVRLAYPDSDKAPTLAPAFIIIGGATLSRGLTIEGLISTFFLRSVGQADTLMQMGRWFGYRKGYELLPRLWITKKTHKQFEFLAELDQELRDEIQYMDITGRSPSEYGPKVKNSPKVSFIRITAKNRMQSAIAAQYDFSGVTKQTYLFDNDKIKLQENITCTEEFISKLGDEWIREDEYDYHNHAATWRSVSFDLVRGFIEKFHFQERLGVFNDMQPLLNWIEVMTKEGKLTDWNVIVVGKGTETDNPWILPNGHKISKINRSRKITGSDIEESILNIGVLRNPKDIIIDVDLNNIDNKEDKENIERFINGDESRGVTGFRDKAGLEATPQLLIYCIDKNSKARVGSALREDLRAEEDIIGLNIYIPGGRIGTSYASKVSVQLKNDLFNGDADLEDIDEN